MVEASPAWRYSRSGHARDAASPALAGCRPAHLLAASRVSAQASGPGFRRLSRPSPRRIAPRPGAGSPRRGSAGQAGLRRGSGSGRRGRGGGRGRWGGKGAAGSLEGAPGTTGGSTPSTSQAGIGSTRATNTSGPGAGRTDTPPDIPPEGYTTGGIHHRRDSAATERSGLVDTISTR